MTTRVELNIVFGDDDDADEFVAWLQDAVTAASYASAWPLTVTRLAGTPGGLGPR